MTHVRNIEPFYAMIGRRIMLLRKERNLSMAALGAKMDPPIDRAMINNIEKGRQRLLVHRLRQFANALNCDIYDIL